MMNRPARRARRGRGDAGMTVVAWTLAVAFSLLLVTLLVEVIVVQYARAAIRDALDEGVRAGTRVGSGQPDCQQRADEALDGLLGGTVGAGITITCTDAGDRMVAQATGTIQGWLPISPDTNINLTATAAKEDR
jgi:hypothetical protein